MTTTVLQVGPDSVRVLAGGSGRDLPAGLAEAALDWIDDPVGLLGDAPVAVADLWRSVMTEVVGERCEEVLIVHPEDWPAPRIGRVLAAANAVADRVSALSRAEWTPPCPEIGAPDPPPRSHRLIRPAVAIAAGIVAVAAVVVAVVAARLDPPAARPDPSVARPVPAAVVEGRIIVEVPPDWAVERVTAGPGSRRVQVRSPADPAIALHLTQAYAPETTQARTAEVLRQAIDGQPAGVFDDFRPDGRLAGRQAVTYREVRPGRIVQWAVLTEGVSRIGIGCQSPPGRERDVRDACERAVRSARQR